MAASENNSMVTAAWADQQAQAVKNKTTKHVKKKKKAQTKTKNEKH